MEVHKARNKSTGRGLTDRQLYNAHAGGETCSVYRTLLQYG